MLDRPNRTRRRTHVPSAASQPVADLRRLQLRAGPPFADLAGSRSSTAVLAREGLRADCSYDLAASFALPWKGLASFLIPPGDDFRVNWEYNLYLGSATVLAACLGWCHLKNAETRALWVVAAFALLLALGAQTPFFQCFYACLPGMGFFRLHSRATL